jgi:hypothetical protein
MAHLHTDRAGGLSHVYLPSHDPEVARRLDTPQLVTPRPGRE